MTERIPEGELDTTIPPSGAGCVECESEGSWWFHLRRCAVCGHIGCCDQSVGAHATAHARATGHRWLRSYEPGEDWFWDYAREVEAVGPVLASPLHHPLDQSTPGPAERVPHDWQYRLRTN